MIRAVALDDEPLALDLIEAFCRRFSFITLEKKFFNTASAKKYITENAVDLLFLDINMPAISGIDFYRSLEIKPMLIFTTSHGQYAVKSYDLNAIDYLLKPFTFPRFELAINKAYQQYNFARNSFVTEEPKSVLLKADYGVVKVLLTDIIFIEGLDNYLKIHLEKQSTLVVRMTMKVCLELLDSPDFIRVHRSYIVPISRIDSVKHKIISIGEEGIPIGKNFEENVKAAINR